MLANTLSIICMTFEILGACQSILWEFSVLSVLQTEALSSSLSILDTIYIRDLLQLQTSFTKSFVPPPPLERWSVSSASFCPTNDKVLHKSRAFSLSYSLLHECDPGFWYLAFLRLFQREEPFLISPHGTFPCPISTLSLTHRSSHIVSQRKRVLIPRYYLKNISVCVMYCAYVLMRTPQHGCRRAMVGVGPSLPPCSRQGLSFCHCFIYTKLSDLSVSGAVFCFNLLSYNRSVATADVCTFFFYMGSGSPNSVHQAVGKSFHLLGPLFCT